jgi:pimeloyl-ACP methyl ester carboxylesterase
MSKLGVVTIHGMGNQGSDYADDSIEEIRSVLRSQGHNPNHIKWKSIHWGPILNGRENELYRRLSQDHDLDWTRIRRDVIVGGLGDALAYMGPPFADSVVYSKIHKRIAVALSELRDELDNHDTAPLVILAHSLGCAVISNYLWDHQQANGNQSAEARTPFSKGETVSGLITFGCNMPLFTLALPPTQVKAIAFPGKAAKSCFPGSTKAQRTDTLKWMNYFDADDILGYPLKPINAAYNKAVSEDKQIQTGTVFGAHTSYWTDNDFTRPVARQLAGLLDLLGA